MDFPRFSFEASPLTQEEFLQSVARTRSRRTSWAGVGAQITVTMFSFWTSIPTQVVEFDMTGPSCIVALVRFAPD